MASTSAAPRSAATRRTTSMALGGSVPATTVMPGLMMPAFSKAISAQRRAQVLLMVEPDGGDGAGHGGNDVGGVEPAAEAHLDDRTSRFRPGGTARTRWRWWPRRTSAGRAATLPATRRSARSSTSCATALKVAVSTGGVADDEPFGDVGQVGRRVARGAQAGRAQRRVHHGRDRAFAVGAGDVQRGEAALGVAERLAESRDVLEPQLDAEGFERGKPIEQGVVSAWGPPRRRRSVRAPRPAPALLP